MSGEIPMRKGLIVSIAFHAAILFFAVAVFPFSGDTPPPKPTPLPVDLVTPAELTKLKAGTRTAEEKEDAKAEKKPEPAEKKAEEKTRPPEKKTVKAPAPKPEPAPKPKPKKAESVPKKPDTTAEATPLPQRKPKKPKSKPKQVAAKPKPRQPERADKNFDPDKIAALLNKVPDAGPQTPAAPQAQQPPAPAQGRADGQDMTMTFNEIDALRAKISQCWNPPVGGLGADAIQVKLRLKLRQDGVLSSAPEVVNRAGSPFFQAAADAAVRAVMLCQPYDLLPPRKYALWRDMILNFDPREMFGG